MKIKDGTAEFRVRDQRLKAMIDFFFPVGAIYTCVTKPSWMEEYGEWQEVGSGRVLWGADDGHEAGTEIEAGLPNIKGTLDRGGIGYPAYPLSADGAFKKTNKESETALPGGEYVRTYIVKFDASNSNLIYGSSDTVQPPAYVVHFYQRIF